MSEHETLEKLKRPILKMTMYGISSLLVIAVLVCLFYMPSWAEKLLSNQLKNLGYHEIMIDSLAWSEDGLGLMLNQLHAQGEKLPEIRLGKTVLRLDSTQLLEATLALNLKSQVFGGDISLGLSRDLWRNSGAITSSVSGKNLKLEPSSLHPQLDIASVEIKNVNYALDAASQPRLTVSSIAIKGVNTPNMAINAGEHIFPSAIAEVQMQQIVMTDEYQFTVGELQISKGQTGLDDKPLVHFDTLGFEQFSWQQGKAITIKSVFLDTAEVNADIDAQSRWSDWLAWLSALPVDAKNEPEKANNPKVSDKPSAHMLAIENVDVNAVKINFSDASKHPVVGLPITIQALTVQEIKGSKPIHWQGSGLIGKQGQWQVKSVVTPLDWQQASEANIKIEGLELSPLSGYTAASFGKGIRSGNFDLQTDLVVRRGTLKIEGDLFARKVTLNSIQGLELQPNDLMPLDSALDVLRDSDDNITLHFLSEGKLDDPSFQVNGVWDKVLSKAASTSVMYMVGQALQPYALAFAAGEFLYDQSQRIKLKPIVFVEGDATGKDAQPDIEMYGQKISALLVNKPNLVLEICPFYTSDESSKAVYLSTERTSKLTDGLMKLGVPSNRITHCLPALDEERKAKPRLQLRLI